MPTEPPIAGQGAARGQARPPLGRRRLWRWLLAIVAVVLLPIVAIVGYLALNARELADRIVDNVPLEQEVALGELGLAEARLRVRLIEQGPAVDALRSIGGRLTADSRFRYRWFVADRPESNAVALPGGVVIVHAGLFQLADSAEDMAAVLAHEVSHAERRHALRASVQQLGLAGLAGLLLGGGAGFADAAATLGERKFSRDAEREADLDGLRRLVAARIDPRALPRVVGKLADRPADGLLATHPATAERVAALQAEVSRLAAGGLPPAEPIVIDWAAARASLRR